jgi:hypothetical protein
MTELERFKQYMELCGVYTNKELVTDGNYPNSVQYLGRILNGHDAFTPIEQQRCYQAVNVARAKHLRDEAEKLEGKKDEQVQ